MSKREEMVTRTCLVVYFQVDKFSFLLINYKKIKKKKEKAWLVALLKEVEVEFCCLSSLQVN